MRARSSCSTCCSGCCGTSTATAASPTSRNVTDVDDKINDAAADEGAPIGVITERYLDAYHDRHRQRSACLPPDIEPRATETSAEMIAMIERLIATGHAYAAEGHVLFNVPTYAGLRPAVRPRRSTR